MLASSEEPANKMRRLNTGEDWNRKLLASGPYAAVVPDGSVPFVNRHEEMFDLFEANADVILRLQRARAESLQIDNWRPCRVAIAAQMFGSGKTTLGRNFIQQLKDSEYEKFAKEKIARLENKMIEESLEAEWNLMKRARTLYWDLSGCHTVEAVADRLTGKSHGDVSGHIANHVMCKAIKGGATPLFVHFDEVGELGNQVGDLREAIRQTWSKMLEQEADQPMQRIYFFLSGRDVPLNALGKPGSPIGTKWIILDMLKEEHIKSILSTSTLSQKLREFSELNGLPKTLVQWTGGSPRLLVYCLRALHHLSEEGVSTGDGEQTMEMVYSIFQEVQAIAGEVFLAAEDEGDWRETWMYLILLAQLRVPCHRRMVVHVGNSENNLETLLGRLNIYISKPSKLIVGIEDPFYICHMKMVEKFVRARFSSDCRVHLFLGAETGMNAAQLLECLVEQRIIVKACLGQDFACLWKVLLNPLLDGTMAADKVVVLDKGSPLKPFPKITQQAKSLSEVTLPLPNILHPNNLSAAMEKLDSNKVYRPGQKSGSADTFIKQEGFVIELQDKSGVASGITWSDICKEVNKCLKDGHVIWVLIAIKLSETMLRWVGDKPLVLKAGYYQEEAVSKNSMLLYRPECSKHWTQKIVNGKFEKLPSGKNTTGQHTELLVRENLEVVIAPPSAIKEFLGAEDFEIVQRLAEQKTDEAIGGKIEVPFLSRFYNFGSRASTGHDTATSSGAGPPPASPHRVTIGVQHGDAEGKVKFSTAAAPEVIKEAIRNELHLPEYQRFQLKDADDCGVPVDGNLPPGKYKVVLLEA
ncbi:unnamed protein product [Effrenium voratum]|uniref:Uncharacterized protein n=1 Tax=Effrenium voratum TaxID=2562239 RepID=A0AA36JEI3_9DINO|nr:unnamed protein product [Effrenium voratum]CAJ1428217.1 unnamed protein product [Effrenium voratum]